MVGEVGGCGCIKFRGGLGDIERKMTTRDFMEYPNASADVDSLEEVVMYQQSGRKPFSPIVEVEEEEEDSDGEERRAAVTQRKGPSSREQQSSHKSSTSPLSPSSQHSSSGHSSPRSPPTSTHPPPPTSHPPPLPTQQQSHASMVTNKSRPSHVANPKMSGSAVNHFPSQDRQNEHPKTVHAHGSRTKGGHFGSRGQAGGKTYVSETHHQSADSKALQPARNLPGAKPLYLGSDGHHFGSEPKHSFKMVPSFSDQSSLETTPMSSEASTPINEFHNDQGDRGSPSGASSTSINSLRQQDVLQASSSDTKLSPYHHRDFAGDLSGLESKSDTKLHYASTLPKRSESFSGSTAKQHATTSISQLQTGPRHQFGKFPSSKAEQSSLASVSFNYQQQAAYGGGRHHQRPTVALRVSQFNQNGNHSGGTTQRSNNQGQSPGLSGQGGGGRSKASPVDDKRGVKWRKDKTPSPGNARSPENTVGSSGEDRSGGLSRVRGGGGEGRRESLPGKSSNLTDVSPSSSMEELSEINVPVNESETDSVPLVKPHTHKSSPHYSPYVPPPPPPPPAHLTEQQYSYEPQYDPYVRPDLQTASSSKYQKQHPTPGYPPLHDHNQRFHVLTSKGLRTEQHMKSSLSLAHEAAAKGDVIQLHHMLTNQEFDPMMLDEHNSTLAHKAAMNGHVNVLSFLIKERGIPISMLQIPDENFTTPAMLAIQAGHVDCLQWLVEEGRVPLQVKDTGGETLMHHAAFHGRVKCLEWLLLSIKKNEEQPKEILDDCGVTPAHFAALEGHLDCLQLLMDHGYSVVLPDDKNQKPLNWADAKGQMLCVRYLMMYETCWDLSSKVAHLVERLQILQKQNEQLREGLSLQEQDHQVAMGKLQQQHEEKVAKMREHYVDLTVSMLNMKERENLSQSSVGGGGGGGGATNKPKSQVPLRRAPPEPGSSQRGRTKPPPIPLDMGKRRGLAGRGGEGGGDWDDHDGTEYRTATPQEVLEKQMTSVAQRMNASREARKRQISAMPVRPFSPLSPVVQRMYSYRQEEDMKGTERQRTQRHSESHGDRRPKVKFSSTVTEFPDYSWPLESDRHSDDGTRSTGKSSSGHGSSGHGSSGHGGSGHGGSGHGSSGHTSSGHGGSGHGGVAHSFSGHGGSGHGSSGHGGSGHGLGHGNLGHGSSHSPSQTPGHSPAHSGSTGHGTSAHGVSGYSGGGSGHKQSQDRSVPDGGETGQAKAEAILYQRNSDFRRDSSQYPS